MKTTKVTILIWKLAQQGLTDREIADRVGRGRQWVNRAKLTMEAKVLALKGFAAAHAEDGDPAHVLTFLHRLAEIEAGSPAPRRRKPAPLKLAV